MIWLLISICSKSSATKSSNKLSAKSVYSFGTAVKTSSVFKEAIWAWWEGWISRPGLVRVAMWTTKISFYRSRTAVTNSFFSTSSTCRIVRRTSAIVYNLHLSSRFVKLISTLFKMRNGIPRAMSMLIDNQLENLLKEARSPIFPLHCKKSDYHIKSLKPIAINLLAANIGFTDTKIQLLYKTWPHYIDFVNKIDECFDQILTKLYWVLDV